MLLHLQMSVALTLTTTSSAITMTDAIGLGVGGALVAVILILLLSSKELITSSTMNSPRVRKALNLAIVPLLAVFVLDVVYMVAM